MEIKDRIKEARTSKKITQKELADLVGVTQATITKIETGETKNPSIDIALKIAGALDVDVYSLFGDRSKDNSSRTTSNKEIDRLKFLVFNSLDKYESNQLFLKQFEDIYYDDLEKYTYHLAEFKKGILEKLIEVGFCSQAEIKEYRELQIKQYKERTGKT